MQEQQAAICPGRQPTGEQEDLEPGAEPGEPQEFNFKTWFLQRNFKTGHPGIKSDYARVGDLLGYSPDYIERLVNGRRAPTRRVVRICRMIDSATKFC